jgi:hypothetical protein
VQTLAAAVELDEVERTGAAGLAQLTREAEPASHDGGVRARQRAGQVCDPVGDRHRLVDRERSRPARVDRQGQLRLPIFSNDCGS